MNSLRDPHMTTERTVIYSTSVYCLRGQRLRDWLNAECCNVDSTSFRRKSHHLPLCCFEKAGFQHKQLPSQDEEGEEYPKWDGLAELRQVCPDECYDFVSKDEELAICETLN